ncbi:hypothetical protein VULLAG_LOCUS22630 [Vulpes lagopus]
MKPGDDGLHPRMFCPSKESPPHASPLALLAPSAPVLWLPAPSAAHTAPGLRARPAQSHQAAPWALPPRHLPLGLHPPAVTTPLWTASGPEHRAPRAPPVKGVKEQPWLETVSSLASSGSTRSTDLPIYRYSIFLRELWALSDPGDLVVRQVPWSLSPFTPEGPVHHLLATVPSGLGIHSLALELS